MSNLNVKQVWAGMACVTVLVAAAGCESQAQAEKPESAATLARETKVAPASAPAPVQQIPAASYMKQSAPTSSDLPLITSLPNQTFAAAPVAAVPSQVATAPPQVVAPAPSAPANTATEPAPSVEKPGFNAYIDPKDGRIWALRDGEKPSNLHVTIPHQGPGRRSVKALTRETAIEYIAARPGFNVEVDPKDGRLWVLRDGEKKSNLMVTIPGQGPMGMTLKSLKRETLIEYIATKPGFNVEVDPKDGRLWVLRDGEKKSNLMVSVPAQGPMGMTVKSLKRETIIEYLATRPGFNVEVDPKDGRLWVLRDGEKKSNLMVVRPGRGPLNTTIKGVDAATLDSYLEAL